MFGPEFVGPGGGRGRSHARARPALLRGRRLPHVRRELLARWSPSARPRRRRSWPSPSRTTAPSTSRRAPPASPRPSCTTTAASCRRPSGTEPSRPGPRRQLPLHRAALPHRRQDALVRQPPGRQQGRAAARHQAGVDPPDHLRRGGHHRLAARPVGRRTSSQAIDARRREARRLRPGPVAAHAHRRPAGAAQPHPSLAGALPRPPVRHRLRAHRIGRPGLRAPGDRERPQGGRHRHRRATSGRRRSSTTPATPVAAGGHRASWRSRGRAS